MEQGMSSGQYETRRFSPTLAWLREVVIHENLCSPNNSRQYYTVSVLYTEHFSASYTLINYTYTYIFQHPKTSLKYKSLERRGGDPGYPRVPAMFY